MTDLVQLRTQLTEAISYVLLVNNFGDDEVNRITDGVDARLWPLVSSAVSAARVDERERIAAKIEGRMPGMHSGFLAALEEAADIAREASE